MKKALRMVALVGLMSMALGLMAVPALAADVVVFTGTAQVCGDTIAGKSTAAGCNNASKAQGLYAPGGDALRAPNVNPAKYTGRGGNWSFQSTDCNKINVTTDSGLVACSINAAGKLAPVGGVLGAACGISNGNSGTGKYTAANGTNVDLTNVGWITSAGGTLPITGNYSGAGKKAGLGTLAGVVQAQGGAPCVKSPVTGDAGASQFTVIGVVAQL